MVFFCYNYGVQERINSLEHHGGIAQWLEQSAQLTIWLSLSWDYVSQHERYAISLQGCLHR